MPAALQDSLHATSRPPKLLPSIVFGLGVTAIAFIWLNHINPPFAPSDDGVRDQLMARDCVEIGRCFLTGPLTSVPGIYQGAVWLDLLIAVRLAGGDTASARVVVLCLLALGVGTLYLVVWRWVRPSIALPAAVLLLGGLSLDHYPSQLINPSAAAFPDILTAAALACYALAGRTRHLIVTAFALGVAINVHVGAYSLVPSLAAVVALASRRPLRALLSAATVVLAVAFLTSRAALLANLYDLAGAGHLLFALVGAVVVTLVCAELGGRFQRQSRDTRAWLVGMLLVAPFGAGVLWLLGVQHHDFGATYLHPVLAPAAVLVAAVVALPFEAAGHRRPALRWLPTGGALVGLLCLAGLATQRPRATLPGYWTLADATNIANRARQLGWAYEDLPFRLQSRACRDLLVGMSVEAPPPRTPAVDKGRKQLQVLYAERDALTDYPDPTAIVTLESGRAALVRDINSWLTPGALVTCRVGADSPNCLPALRRVADAGRRFLFETRSFPEISVAGPRPSYLARYEIPLHPDAGEQRDIILVERSAPGCDWHITRAEGVRLDTRLPARSVRLTSDTGGVGLLVIEKPFGTPACAANTDRRYPPCIIEALPDDPLHGLLGEQ